MGHKVNMLGLREFMLLGCRCVLGGPCSVSQQEYTASGTWFSLSFGESHDSWDNDLTYWKGFCGMKRTLARGSLVPWPLCPALLKALRATPRAPGLNLLTYDGSSLASMQEALTARSLGRRHSFCPSFP